MRHSHMPVQHLLKQVELYRERKAERENRDVRPGWLTEFINEAADLFEPVAGVGRVGFDCRLTEESWKVDLYLGSTEMVGGAADGESRQIDFTFDVSKSMSMFDEVCGIDWNVESVEWNETGKFERKSVLSIDGVLKQERVVLEIHANPPAETGPALRQYQDGRVDTV